MVLIVREQRGIVKAFDEQKAQACNDVGFCVVLWIMTTKASIFLSQLNNHSHICRKILKTNLILNSTSSGGFRGVRNRRPPPPKI